jgi:hypothetical protein
MAGRISTDATHALRAELDCAFACHATGGQTMLLVQRDRFTDARRILTRAGLHAEPFDFDGDDTYLAAAVLTRF